MNVEKKFPLCHFVEVELNFCRVKISPLEKLLGEFVDPTEKFAFILNETAVEARRRNGVVSRLCSAELRRVSRGKIRDSDKFLKAKISSSWPLDAFTLMKFLFVSVQNRDEPRAGVKQKNDVVIRFDVRPETKLSERNGEKTFHRLGFSLRLNFVFDRAFVI